MPSRVRGVGTAALQTRRYALPCPLLGRRIVARAILLVYVRNLGDQWVVCSRPSTASRGRIPSAVSTKAYARVLEVRLEDRRRASRESNSDQRTADGSYAI